MRCQIGNGETTSFWYDSWTSLGPLIDYIGERGVRQLQVPLDGRVINATRDGNWIMPAARSAEAQDIQIEITCLSPPFVSRGPYSFLWINGSGVYVKNFSSKVTWENLRIHSPLVSWHSVVWFKEAIPRCSFIAWLVMLARLPTKDRLRRWGLNVTDQCVLSSSGIETHAHLFFECSFAAAIWTHFASRIWPNPPSVLTSVLSWLTHNQQSSASHHFSTASQASRTKLIKLLLQVIIYILWKERNARIFSSSSSPRSTIISSIDRMMRDLLLSCSGSSSSSVSLLGAYFSMFV